METRSRFPASREILDTLVSSPMIFSRGEGEGRGCTFVRPAGILDAHPSWNTSTPWRTFSGGAGNVQILAPLLIEAFTGGGVSVSSSLALHHPKPRTRAYMHLRVRVCAFQSRLGKVWLTLKGKETPEPLWSSSLRAKSPQNLPARGSALVHGKEQWQHV